MNYVVLVVVVVVRILTTFPHTLRVGGGDVSNRTKPKSLCSLFQDGMDYLLASLFLVWQWIQIYFAVLCVWLETKHTKLAINSGTLCTIIVVRSKLAITHPNFFLLLCDVCVCNSTNNVVIKPLPPRTLS